MCCDIIGPLNLVHVFVCISCFMSPRIFHPHVFSVPEKSRNRKRFRMEKGLGWQRVGTEKGRQRKRVVTEKRMGTEKKVGIEKGMGSHVQEKLCLCFSQDYRLVLVVVLATNK